MLDPEYYGKLSEAAQPEGLRPELLDAEDYRELSRAAQPEGFRPEVLDPEAQIRRAVA